MIPSVRITAGEGRWQRIDAWVLTRVARRSARVDLALADALRVIAAAMRTGSTLQQALQRAAARGTGIVSQACETAAAGMYLGGSVEVETERLAATIDTPAARLFAQVVEVQHRRGGDLGGPCRRLAALLHDRVALDAEARSATAQARFSARAVLAIPVVLFVAFAWRSPATIGKMLEPGPLLVALPGILLVCVGAWVARRIAIGACAVDRGMDRASPRVSRARHLVGRVGGSGPRSRASARLAGLATLTCASLLAVGGARPLALVASGAVIAAAVAWPWSDADRRRRHSLAVADSGIETLLEVSIALFAAGATAHEVATRAPGSVHGPLRAALAPAVHRVELGRTIASSFESLPEVAASPQLDGWLHAVCTSAELGAPANDVLEQLLRDARATRRERMRSVAQTAAPRMQLALVLLVVPGVMWLMLLGTLGGLVQQLRSAGVV